VAFLVAFSASAIWKALLSSRSLCGLLLNMLTAMLLRVLWLPDKLQVLILEASSSPSSALLVLEAMAATVACLVVSSVVVVAMVVTEAVSSAVFSVASF
ncbi:hypothetical protein LOZ48_004006, partial [Ophidiomyces ophidiicola]